MQRQSLLRRRLCLVLVYSTKIRLQGEETADDGCACRGSPRRGEHDPRPSRLLRLQREGERGPPILRKPLCMHSYLSGDQPRTRRQAPHRETALQTQTSGLRDEIPS